MRRGHRTLAAIVALLALTAAACSSTSKKKEDAARPQKGDVLLAPPESTINPPSPTSTTLAARESPRRGGPAPATRTTLPSPSTPRGGTIKIGVLTFKPGVASFPGMSFSAPDSVSLIQAAVAEVNAKGGIAGRRVEVAIVQIDANDANDYSQYARSHDEACVQFTEDHEVFLVVSLDPGGWFARQCYATHHTPYLDYTFADEEDFRRLKPWLLPSPAPNLTKLAGVLVQALRDQGFMSRRVGVWVYDLPSWRRSADRVLLPAIAAAGGNVIDVYYAPVTTTQQLVVDVNAAVLRFHSREVDRVVLWDWGLTWPLFARRAQAQAWAPRYGIHSWLAPDSSLPSIPPAQRPGTVAAGFSPLNDVGDGVFPLTGRERDCFNAINRRAGTNMSRRSTRENGGDGLPGTALQLCQFLEMIRAALAPATGKELAQGELWDYFHALGSEPPVVTPPQTFFSRDQWDGNKHYAHLAYREDCDCFRYTSDWRKIP